MVEDIASEESFVLNGTPRPQWEIWEALGQAGILYEWS